MDLQRTWILSGIHVAGEKAELYLNDARYPPFIVNKMKGTSKAGTIGLYVDVGTEGHFKDFRIISSIHPAMGGGAWFDLDHATTTLTGARLQ